MYMKLLAKPRQIPFLILHLLCALTIISLAISPFAVAASSDTSTINGQVEAQTFYMQFQPGTTRSDAELTVAQMGGLVVGWLAPLHIAQVRHAPSTTLVTASSIWALAQSEPSITFVETGTIVTGEDLGDTFPSDYDDPALLIPDESYGLTQVHALEAWGVVTGTQEVIIAVLDTGINPNHPEFAGRIILGPDYINEDDDPTDDHGHGSHVAGIAAAALDNANGGAGICPNCSILAVKVLNENNAGTWWSAAQGITYAVDHGARVINLSLGANVPSSTIKSAIDYALEKGVFIVAAAGNSASSNRFYPAAYDGVVGVSATNSSDEPWGLSNRGSFIDVAAPGHLIFGPDKTLENEYGGYVYKSGTSMAAPHVAGLAGLLFSQHQERTSEEVFGIITQSASDLGEGSWDDFYGYGRIDALAAVTFDTEAAPGTTKVPPPQANEDELAQIGKTIYLPISRRN